MTDTTDDQGERAERAQLRHIAATIAYRAAKVLRDAPDAFATLALGPATRTPIAIVAHMGDLMDWAVRLADGEYRWEAVPSRGWRADVDRFFEGIATLDRRLDAGPLVKYPAEVMIQGPLADALTHVGQLAMMRGLMGVPIRPESYARAEIVAGRVGLSQSAPTREFDGDASAPPSEHRR